jgi:tetratricopeptide (TPR) repeat protein
MSAPTSAELADRALVHLDEGNLDAALEAADQAVASEPSLAQAHAARAHVRLRRREPYEALADATRAVKLDPGCADGYAVRASVFFDRGDLRQAADDAGKAIAAGHPGAQPYAVRADARVRLGDYDGALADADEVLRRSPWPGARAQARLLRTAAFELRGDADGALAEAETALKQCGDVPDDQRANLHLSRARLWKAQGELDAAAADADAALRLNPADQEARGIRGLIRLDSGDFHGALADAEEVLRVSPEAPAALFIRGAAAEEHLLRSAEEARQKYGPDSFEYLEVLNAVASVYLLTHQYGKAAEAWCRACAVYGRGDAEVTRRRLTYMNDWAEALEKADRADEAERVLRDALAGREALHGRGHAGYAFGLLPLATLLSRRGKHDEALARVDEAAANLLQNGHERRAEALAWRARIVAAAGRPENAFERLDTLSEAAAGQVVQAVARLVGTDRPEPEDRRVTRDLVEWLMRRCGPRHPLTASAWSFISAVEKHLGDHAARMDALRHLLDFFEAQGNTLQACHALVNLAEAHDEARQPAEARRTFRDAVARADRLGRPLEAAWARERYASSLSRSGRADEAEPVLREAVALAHEAGDAGLLGQVLVCLGVVVQHQGKLDEAQDLLREGLPLLPTGHSYFLMARCHLEAIESHSSCSCGDTAATLANAFREFLVAQLPPDFQPRLEVEYVDNEFKVRAYMDDGEPTPEENERLARIVAHARAEFYRHAGGR